MTSTRQSGRSPMSMVSSLSRECRDPAESDMSVPKCPSQALTSFHIKVSSSAKADDPVARGPSIIDGPAFTGYPAFAGYDSRYPACFPSVLAPNKDREIGVGRATRQPGQVRKEAALTRSGSGRSSVFYLFFRANRARWAIPHLALDSVSFRKAGFERQSSADRSMSDAGAPLSSPTEAG